MANAEHLRILGKGVEAWNEWIGSFLELVDLSGADLEGLHLPGVKLMGADLSGCNLTGADLRWSDFSSANLSGANLTHADLSGSVLDSALLLRSDLSEATLGGASFGGADLTSAKLRGCVLVRLNFQWTDLSLADLSQSDLSGARFNSAVLSGADLSRTDLTGVEFVGTKLDGTKFNESSFAFTRMANVALDNSVGLEHVSHHGPSTIGIDTVYQSEGRIPQSFLHGCGVPESFILHAKSLIGAEEGIQFYSCFISYSGKDEEFAKRLYGRLQQERVRVWFAPEDVQGGKKLYEQIEEAIRHYDKLLILLSPNSLQSEWVMTELRKARKEERKTGKRKLFPVCLVDYETLRDWVCFDADSGQDLAAEVRQYFIPDFTDWKNHDAFEARFSRLLKDLRAEVPAAK